VLPLIEDPKQVPGGVQFEQQLAKARQELEDHIDAEFGKLTENFRQRIGDYLVRAATTEPDITETAQFALSLVPEDFRPSLMLRTRRFLEQRARRDDRVFGPWAELMALPEAEFSMRAAAVVADAKRRNGDGAAVLNPLVAEALSKAALTNMASVARAYGRLLREVYEESKKPVALVGPASSLSSSGQMNQTASPSSPEQTGKMPVPLSPDQRELLEIVTGPEGPLWFPRRDTPDHMSRAEKDRYGSLVASLDKIAVNATNPPPARAMVVADLPAPYAPHVFKRGNPSRLGEEVPRAFLQVLSGGGPQPFTHGSGRLDLARAMASPPNPLTARVLVNRVWMEHFGEPLVASPSDFGTRSDPPTHPALLDWLAAEFISSGWSLKHLHRVIVLSGAYQQASAAADASRLKSNSAKMSVERGLPAASSVVDGSMSKPEGRAPAVAGVRIDPENKWLWHYPRRRLDLEAMRDSLLFISGRLDLTMGGRPVDVAGDPLNGRRTVYGLVDRQNLPALFRAFDFAVPDQCVERRPRTTVPQQALFALNSPFVMEQTRALVALPEIAGEANPARRVEAMFRRVLGRKPTKGEAAAAVHFIEAAKSDDPIKDGLTAWEQFAQILLATNELAFVD
jgi:hypothetical protein